MTLRNAFENLAIESTANTHLKHSVTIDKELMKAVLTELKIMNLYLRSIVGDEFTEADIDGNDLNNL